MTRVLVTGATGMLGSYVAARAQARGWQVRALVRDPAAAVWLENRGVELVAGDLLSAGTLRRAARGCDALVHAAAAIGAGGPADAYRHANVVGTENVVDAAAWSGARLVHVSSTAVVGAARYRHEPTDETVSLPRLPAWDAYGRSKQDAERRVLGAVEAGRIWASVVRPPVMYGRRDRQFTPRVAPVLSRGVAPVAEGGRTTLPLVHAGSVADGIVAALERDRARGRVYHLTEDAPVTVVALWRAAGQGLGRPVRVVSLPRALVATGFLTLAAVLALAGRGTLARHATGTYRMLTRPNPFSAERARQELGWRPALDPHEALADAFRWWQERAAAGSAP